MAQRPFSPQTYLAYDAITGPKALAQATPQSSLATLPLAQKKEPFRRRAFLMLLSKTLPAVIALALSLLDFPRISSNLLSLGFCLFPGGFCLQKVICDHIPSRHQIKMANADMPKQIPTHHMRLLWSCCTISVSTLLSNAVRVSAGTCSIGSSNAA